MVSMAHFPLIRLGEGGRWCRVDRFFLIDACHGCRYNGGARMVRHGVARYVPGMVLQSQMFSGVWDGFYGLLFRAGNWGVLTQNKMIKERQ